MAANETRPLRLTELALLAGCTAKTGADSLERLLAQLSVDGREPEQRHEGLLVGLSEPDDAAVFQPETGRAIIVTVDFFAPLVDDPYAYGAIAAANAMSDVYAMGGEVMLALNVSAMPADLDEDTLAAIFRGGQDKVCEAGGLIVGGHTIMDAEPKYGLCVLGTVEPQRVLRKRGAQPGDVLYLTKPIGSGIITTAAKFEEAEEAHLAAAVAVMSSLNREAARVIRSLDAHAMTDVTGFSLLGHAHEMAQAGGVRFVIAAADVPLLDGALDYAYRGILNGGIFRNRKHLDAHVEIGAGVSEDLGHVLFDPQTSGGLLVAVAPGDAADCEAGFAAAGLPVWRVGGVENGRGVLAA